MSTTNRKDRDETSRDADMRIENWTPPGVLETPKAPDGYRYRWVRAESRGQDDSKNVTRAQRQGYTAVSPDELPAGYVTTVLEHGDKAVVSEGDLILMKIPEKFVEQRNKYFNERTERTQMGIDQQLFKNSHEHMPISNKGTQSSVTKGRPAFQEED